MHYPCYTLNIYIYLMICNKHWNSQVYCELNLLLAERRGGLGQHPACTIHCHLTSWPTCYQIHRYLNTLNSFYHHTQWWLWADCIFLWMIGCHVKIDQVSPSCSYQNLLIVHQSLASMVFCLHKGKPKKFDFKVNHSKRTPSLPWWGTVCVCWRS